jgi:hypothetical protein
VNGLWLRLYSDTPHCLKLRKLAPAIQLGYIWFLCLHKEDKLLDVSETDLAWTLRVSLAEVHEWIVVLTEAGLLLPDRTPKGWNERQFVSDCSTERVRQHRAKRFGNVSETPPETETETETETERDSGVPAPRPPPKNGIAFDYATGILAGVTEEDKSAWGVAYPALDIESQVARAVEWLKANPTKRKKNVRSYLVRWFAKAQEHGGDHQTLFNQSNRGGNPNI